MCARPLLVAHTPPHQFYGHGKEFYLDRTFLTPSHGHVIAAKETQAWNRGRHSPEPTCGTIDGAPSVQTPSRAEHGLGGRFHFCAVGLNKGRIAEMPTKKRRVSSFDLDETTIEDISLGIATVYEKTDLAHYPLLRWVQILHDATILGEDVRRNRTSNAIDRAGRVLMRLLDFTGHYLYIHRPNPRKPHFADIVSSALKMRSYTSYFDNSGPEEGPTRWIKAKYPSACAKCGKAPCVCLVEPWVFEERREKPGPYEKYRKDTETLRMNLKDKATELFTLPSLFKFFNDIYRNSHYHQDAWKLTMHLAEELGEATVELSRLEFAWLGERQKFNVTRHIRVIKEEAEIKIRKDIVRIKSRVGRQKMKSRAQTELDEILPKLRGEGAWDAYVGLVSERFKEEIADVFSWLAGVILKLSNGKYKRKLRQITDRYIEASGHRKLLKCPWCGKGKCKNSCLISHGITEELIEKALKF